MKQRNEDLLAWKFPWAQHFKDLDGNTVLFNDLSFMPRPWALGCTVPRCNGALVIHECVGTAQDRCARAEEPLPPQVYHGPAGGGLAVVPRC